MYTSVEEEQQEVDNKLTELEEGVEGMHSIADLEAMQDNLFDIMLKPQESFGGSYSVKRTRL